VETLTSQLLKANKISAGFIGAF